MKMLWVEQISKFHISFMNNFTIKYKVYMIYIITFNILVSSSYAIYNSQNHSMMSNTSFVAGPPCLAPVHSYQAIAIKLLFGLACLARL